MLPKTLPKSAQERAKGLAELYWSTVRQEEPAKPVRLPETLPPDHPWAACWQKSGFAGKEIIPDPVRVIRTDHLLFMCDIPFDLAKTPKNP